MSTEYQIQARLKGGEHWEPISLERRDGNGERRYHFASEDEATAAVSQFQAMERTLPFLILNEIGALAKI